MTRVIVNDASCLIDLRKGGLLEVLCDLPYRLVIPLPVRASEVLDFSVQQWRHLDDHGMITHDLTPDEVAQAFALRDRHRAPVCERLLLSGCRTCLSWDSANG